VQPGGHRGPLVVEVGKQFGGHFPQFAVLQRVAVADCLRYVPHATLNSCVSRVDPSRAPDVVMAAESGAPGAARTVMTTAVPVSFAYR
jgi:hypothetical protein